VLAGNVTTVHEMRVRPAGKAGADFVGFGGADGGPEDMGCLSLTLQNDSGLLGVPASAAYAKHIRGWHDPRRREIITNLLDRLMLDAVTP
jgi:hypothetical protein